MLTNPNAGPDRILVLKFDPGLPLELGSNTVEVWKASFTNLQEEFERYYALLSQDELERAGRFYFERDRRAYILGRGLLRTLLSGYTRTPAGQIEFCYQQRGKPALITPSQEAAIHFNLSHAKDLVVYAFSREANLGIDVEHVRLMENLERIAEQYFTASESAYIHSLPEPDKVGAFFHIWTCKEACLKASGDGLAAPLDLIEINLEDGASSRLIKIPGREDQAVWRLETFEIDPGYLASLAVEGESSRLILRQFP
jgi:4'-phosphopantetheinyl transferase